MKIKISALGELVLGYFIGVTIARMSARKRRGLTNDSGLHTFKINELTSPDSVSFEELREKITHGL